MTAAQRQTLPSEQAISTTLTKAAPKEVTSKSWLATLVAGTGMGFDAYVINLPVILVVGVAARYHTTTLHVASIQSIFLIGYFIGTLLFSVAADYVGRRVTLAVSIIGYSAATVFTGFVPTLLLFTIGRFTTAVLGGGEQSVGCVYACEAWPDKWRGWGTGNMFSFYPLGVMMLLLAGIYIEPHFGVTAPFAIAGFMGLAILILRYYVLESGRFSATKQVRATSGVRRKFPVWQVISTPSLRRGWLGALIVNLGDNFTYHGLSVAFILYLHSVYKLTGTHLFALLLPLYAAQFVLSVLGSYLSDIVGRRAVGVGCSVGVIGGLVVMLQQHSLLGTLLLAAVAQGLALGPAWSVKLTLSPEVFPTEIRASGIAMTLGLGRIAAFAAPVAATAGIAALGIRHELYIYLGSALVTLVGYLIAPDLRRKPIDDLVGLEVPLEAAVGA